MSTDPEVAPPDKRSAADTAGAALIALAMLGALAWTWKVLATQFVDDPGSLGDRIDALASQLPTLLLAALVAGIGIAIRILSAKKNDSAYWPVFGRPLPLLLLVLVASLAAILTAGAASSNFERIAPVLHPEQIDMLRDLDRIVTVQPVEVERVIVDEPPRQTHVLAVHTDGCGVLRSGEIGEPLTWVVRDEDGFQVAGRNAAGEVKFRYHMSGTYTVALETWASRYYVETSNTVTINC